MYYLSNFSEKEEKKFRFATKPILRDTSKSVLAGGIVGGGLGLGLETMKNYGDIQKVRRMNKNPVMEVVNPDGQKYTVHTQARNQAVKNLRKNFRKGVLQKAAIGAGALGGISLAGGIMLSNSKKARQDTDAALKQQFNKRINKPLKRITKEANYTNKHLKNLRDYGEY